MAFKDIDWSKTGHHIDKCSQTGERPHGTCAECTQWQQEYTCRAIGHADAHRSGACDVCGRETQYVRAEVYEGRTYTYQAFEDPPLAPGEKVLLPGNQVQGEPFVGTVLRLLDGPDKNYNGPYKAVIRRDFEDLL